MPAFDLFHLVMFCLIAVENATNNEIMVPNQYSKKKLLGSVRLYEKIKNVEIWDNLRMHYTCIFVTVI